jgi:hypothetical protein
MYRDLGCRSSWRLRDTRPRRSKRTAFPSVCSGPVSRHRLAVPAYVVLNGWRARTVFQCVLRLLHWGCRARDLSALLEYARPQFFNLPPQDSRRVLSLFEDRILPVDSVVARRCASLHVPDPAHRTRCADRGHRLCARYEGRDAKGRRFRADRRDSLNPWMGAPA